jgi:SWI/SNF-related matrix-associated actin-dependent regulator 1 of chromatin subfamily A
MQRIKKEEVLKDLPKKIREVIAVDVDNRAPEIIAYDRKTLSKFQGSSRDWYLELGEYAELRHENGLAKVDWSAAFIENILTSDQNEALLVFAHHRSVVDKLARALSKFKPEVINGGVSNEKRTEIEDKFQSGKTRLVLGNIDAMNLGLTLTKATRVIFVEYSWTPALNEQAEDRANRIGSKWSILCQYIVLPGSIDEDILISNLTKMQRIEKVGA